MKNIILIGFACCGKSTVGKLLADELGCDFVDTDCEIAKRSKLTIAEIFERYGESGFRQMENEVMTSLPNNGAVVACGGGSVLVDGFATLASNSLVVWLTATAQTVRERLGGANRPLFDKLNVEQLQEYISHRVPIYQKYANFTASTDGKTPEQVAEDIYKCIRYE